MRKSVFTAFCLLVLMACAGAAGQAAVQAWSFDAAGNLAVLEDQVGQEPIFIPFASQGTAMEIIAVRGKDGKVRVAFNTCNVCNGSPKAFFTFEKCKFICQNCKNAFPAEMVGEEVGGCAPMAIPGAMRRGGSIMIPRESISAYRDRFLRWKKGMRQ